jgi:hypothetical protein
MRYEIEGTPERGYTIRVGTSPVMVNCPCCGKPMMTLHKASLIARNMQLIDDYIRNKDRALKLSCVDGPLT